MSEPLPFSPTVTLLTVGRSWEAEFTEALKPLGLTTRKYGLLGHIRRTPGISFSELARRSRITVQSAHAAVTAFVAAGLVDDGTSHAGSASRLQVTADGEALLARAAEEVVRLDRTFTAQHPELAEALRAHMVQMLARRPHAVHMPLEVLPERCLELPDERLIIAFCTGGLRSAGAANLLVDNGFDAANMSSGLVGWRAAGGPLT